MRKRTFAGLAAGVTALALSSGAAMLTTVGPIPAAHAQSSSGLLPVGKPAPNFNLPTPGGKKLNLSSAVRTKKATLINFWFYN